MTGGSSSSATIFDATAFVEFLRTLSPERAAVEISRVHAFNMVRVGLAIDSYRTIERGLRDEDAFYVAPIAWRMIRRLLGLGSTQRRIIVLPWRR